MGGEAKRTPSLKSVTHILQFDTVIPYLKKFQKLYESRDRVLYFCWHQHFLPEIRKFCYIKKYRYRFHLDTYFLIHIFLKNIPQHNSTLFAESIVPDLQGFEKLSMLVTYRRNDFNVQDFIGQITRTNNLANWPI